MPLVTAEIDGRVATVTLRRGEKLNSLNDEMIAELDVALHRSAESARVVILRAEPGVTVFSAGHDIDHVPVGAEASEWDNPVEKVITAVPELPVPVIAAVEGSVWGAACNLVVACDMIVATRTATFAITPAKLGVPYFPAGISLFARSLPLHVVKSMYFTAAPLTATDAHQYGMVHALVADEAELTHEVQGLAERISSLAPLTLRSVKAELARLDPYTGISARVASELRAAAWHSNDVREGVAAFRERRRPRFEGS